MTSSEGDDDGGKKQPREEEFRATGEVIAIRRAIGWGGAITPLHPTTPAERLQGSGVRSGTEPLRRDKPA